MYLLLMHGRKDPRTNLDNWGSDGPILKIDWLHVTYNATFHVGWIQPDGTADETELYFAQGCLFYDNIFYGDWEVMAAPPEDKCPDVLARFEDFDNQKAEVPDVFREAWARSENGNTAMLDTWVRAIHGDAALYNYEKDKNAKS
jgi:hypothetical protein